nr:AF4/FMR2 family member lilli [Bactrocera oleae]
MVVMKGLVWDSLVFKKPIQRQQQQHRRTNTSSHSQSPEQGQGQQRQQSAAPSPNASSSCEAVTLRVANPLDNSTTRQRRQREGNVSGRNQFANRVLCRTPPPVYDSLPATPPPSYTPHSEGVAAGVVGVRTADGRAVVGADVVHSAEVWQECQAFSASQCGSNVADYVEVLLPAGGVAYQQQLAQQRAQQQLVQFGENAAPTIGQQQEQQQQPEPPFEAHIQVGQQQLQQLQQQHLRRRRRLHLLQRQRLSNINATSTDSTSSSSNCNLSNRNNNNNSNNYHFYNPNPIVGVSGPDGGGSSSDSEAYARLPIGSECRRQRRQQRIGRGLRDAYCPDLLHACSLILHQQSEPTLEPNETSNESSVSNFTATPPRRTHSCCSTEYVEIDEIRPVARDREGERFRNLQPSNWQPQIERAISTPELRPCVYNGGDIGVSLNVEDTESRGDVEYQRLATNLTQRDMGQNLSLRRPRISLTWVLREQQQQQQQQQQESQNEIQVPMNGDDEPSTTNCKQLSNDTLETPNNNNGCVNGLLAAKQRTEVVPTQLTTTSTTNTATTTTTTTTKRYRLKQLPVSTDPLNGYATTPTAHMPANALAPQKFFSNQNLLEYRDKTRTPSRELLFVCTPQRLPKSYDNSEALSLAKKRNEIRKRLAAKMATLQTNDRANADGAEANQLVKNGCGAAVAGGGVLTPNGIVLEKDELKSLKGTYSEPSLIAASEGQHRRHRHRKRRERNRVPKFGYEISNVDEFLSKCSLAAPGNIPVVLSAASTLYQTRPGQHQIEIPLPLGMVVNAVFKNQNWLYVQTPHAEEGYVVYTCCLPLGILPQNVRSGAAVNNKPAPCWESNGDIFPRPGGNMTDSEKEIRLRGGTRSDGARTPRGKRGDAVGTDVDATNGNATPNISTTASTCGEHQVDRLYLRAASQPRLVEKAYAQLKSTKQALALRNAGNDEYVTLQQQQQQQQHKSKLHVQKHMQQQQQQLQQLQHKPLINGSYITNGHNGQHLHPKNTNNTAAVSVASNATPSITSMSHSASFAANSNTNGSVKSAKLQQHASVLHIASRKQHGLRQTLVAINTDYSTESIVLHKGEIVTLCECRESKDHRQWFYVRTRDGREGYIPAEVAGHGYL